MAKLENPFPLFIDAKGALLHAGSIYVGETGKDPQANPIEVFWDAALTIAAPQPLRTVGGYIERDQAPANVYWAEEDASIEVLDANDERVAYTTSFAETGGVAYQPEDSDLTAIAALSTTGFGRSLLTLANSAALKAAAGVTNFTGGSVTSNIIRSGGGAHVYFAGAAFTGARIVGVDPAGTADATSQPGDMQFFY